MKIDFSYLPGLNVVLKMITNLSASFMFGLQTVAKIKSLARVAISWLSILGSSHKMAHYYKTVDFKIKSCGTEGNNRLFLYLLY